ncbi:MAG: RNA polymerase sigma factor [Acidobacteria bacterium]|nr:RNA polymerase sigma factor [Acidobacteriota bacterium]
MPVVDDPTDGTWKDAGRPLSFTMSVESWRQLFGDIADRRSGALEGLYDAVAPHLFGLAVCRTRNREDAADVVAETFARVAQQGPRLRSVRDPRSWLLTVTRRLTVDVARERVRRAAEPLETAACIAASAAEPGRRLDARRAARLLALLPDHQREVIYLRHFTDCTFAAIGRIIGIPTFTAASRYRLGVRRLRALMEEAT